MAMPDRRVTDIGCGSCGLWSYGFVRGAADFGAEVSGLLVSDWALDGEVGVLHLRALAG